MPLPSPLHGGSGGCRSPKATPLSGRYPASRGSIRVCFTTVPDRCRPHRHSHNLTGCEGTDSPPDRNLSGCEVGESPLYDNLTGYELGESPRTRNLSGSNHPSHGTGHDRTAFQVRQTRSGHNRTGCGLCQPARLRNRTGYEAGESPPGDNLTGYENTKTPAGRARSGGHCGLPPEAGSLSDYDLCQMLPEQSCAGCAIASAQTGDEGIRVRLRAGVGGLLPRPGHGHVGLVAAEEGDDEDAGVFAFLVAVEGDGGGDLGGVGLHEGDGEKGFLVPAVNGDG